MKRTTGNPEPSPVLRGYSSLIERTQKKALAGQVQRLDGSDPNDGSLWLTQARRKGESILHILKVRSTKLQREALGVRVEEKTKGLP